MTNSTHREQVLRQSGLKVTLPRTQVLEVFKTSAQRHLAAEDVYRILLLEHIDLGLATVYRVLAQFEQTGVLKKSLLGQNRAVYELNDGEQHHGHLVCTRTGQVQEFFDPVVEERLQAIAVEHGLELSGCSITLYGVSRWTAEGNSGSF